MTQNVRGRRGGRQEIGLTLTDQALVDIDMEGEVAEDTRPVPSSSLPHSPPPPPPPPSSLSSPRQPSTPRPPPEHKFSKLATPAVRRICKEKEIDISHVCGTGKDGRVLKEDVINFVQASRSRVGGSAIYPPSASTETVVMQETTAPLGPVQMQMFKTMTKSLSIPHFLFSDEVYLDSLTNVRSRINSDLSSTSPSLFSTVEKISYMPFFLKAMSLALQRYPILNARLNTETGTETETETVKPTLIMRPQHNIGVAMDTPAGLLVPNIKNVQLLSILEIGAELNRLQKAGMAGKLSPADLAGGTITISNIGNIGGRVVSPVIVSSELAILGVGKAKTCPAFDANGTVVPRTEVVFSWSADHRVIDGATMARMATLMKQFVEKPELMLARMK